MRKTARVTVDIPWDFFDGVTIEEKARLVVQVVDALKMYGFDGAKVDTITIKRG